MRVTTAGNRWRRLKFTLVISDANEPGCVCVYGLEHEFIHRSCYLFRQVACKDAEHELLQLMTSAVEPQNPNVNEELDAKSQ